MIFTIRTVEPAFASNDKEYLKVTGSTSEGAERTYNVFDTLKDKWSLLEPNATVELKLARSKNKDGSEGKYWNVGDISKVVLPPVAEEAVKQGAKVISVKNKSEKDVAIARAVALKASIELCCNDKIERKDILEATEKFTEWLLK